MPHEVGEGDRKHTRWTREEVFRCQEICRRSGTAELDEGQRARRNCTLPGFDPARWCGSELVQIHMGLPPRFDREGEDKDWFKPVEDIQNEGCPGGWYRCAFVSSLHKYRRAGSEQKTENLLLSRCQDKLIIEAIAYLEDEERHALNYFYECRDG